MQDLSWLKAHWPDVQRVYFASGLVGAATIFNETMYGTSTGQKAGQSDDEVYAASVDELRETIEHLNDPPIWAYQ